MGVVIVVIIIALIAWNAVRTMGRQKKRMKEQRCTGDCKTCKDPCEVKRIYHMNEPSEPEAKENSAHAH